MTPATHTVNTPDGIRVVFDQYAGDRSHVLVMCHGFFQSRSTRDFQQMARVFAQQTDVVSLDFRGHGDSSGWYTFSAKEDAELHSVLAWAKAQYARAIVMGFSMGGAIAMNTVDAHRPFVTGLVAVSAPAAFEDVEFKFWTPEAIRTGWESLGAGVGCRPGNPFLPKQRPVESVARLSGLPLLFIHGTKDVIVGVEHSRRLFAAASEPKQLSIIEGGGHAEVLFRRDPEGFVRLVNDWMGGDHA